MTANLSDQFTREERRILNARPPFEKADKVILKALRIREKIIWEERLAAENIRKKLEAAARGRYR